MRWTTLHGNYSLSDLETPPSAEELAHPKGEGRTASLMGLKSTADFSWGSVLNVTKVLPGYNTT